ncbi:MAG: LemA family protein [Bacteroidetes bacterium]|nr:LemA family protein [Bacteroidota bacterium]MBP6315187.1 LemA family protein [Chitinophagaceae bacterium]
MKNVLIVLAILAVIFFVGKSSYNGLITKDEDVKKTWAEVQNQYQRRSDLIGNLVNTVKGAANFEQKTLTDVINARASATQMKIDINDATPEKMAAYQAAQGQLGQALGRLMMITENYPTLKANQNFLDLQAQLEGTENRVTVARKDFNESVQTYNTKVRSFPTNLFAGMVGLKVRPTFEADAASQKAPEVKF